MSESLHVRMIIEIMGRPPEHIEDALKKLVERVGAEKDITLLRSVVHKSVIVKDTKDLFTTFAEVEVEVPNLSEYFRIIFTYMPSNIEIIRPEKLTLRNDELNTLGGALCSRLHDYDAITKRVIAERNMAIERLRQHGLLPTQPVQQHNQAKQSHEHKKKHKKAKTKNKPKKKKN